MKQENKSASWKTKQKKNISEDKLRELRDNIRQNIFIFIYRGARRRSGRERGRTVT